MRIGVISDIHSNIIALNAVLRSLNAANCEQLICCGDIIGVGRPGNPRFGSAFDHRFWALRFQGPGDLPPFRRVCMD